MSTTHYPSEWRESDLNYIATLNDRLSHQLTIVPSEKDSLEDFVKLNLEAYLSRADELLNRIAELINDLSNLEEAAPKTVAPFAIQLQLTGQGIYTETAALKETLEEDEGQSGGTMGFASSTPAGTRHKVRNWFKQLRAILKRMLGAIWNLLRSLLAPESWKLKGGMGHGVPGIFNAEIELEIGD